jgi:cell division protein FtsN
MPDELAPAAVKNARDLAHKARQLSDAYQRAQRAADPADLAQAGRGDELKRLAAEASARFEVVKQQVRGAASVKRRQEDIAHDAQLQGRLRAEAQARREAAAGSESPPPRRGHR